MSQALREKVITLKKIKHGESDLIIYGLNRSGERMGFIAKGALRSRRRFGGGVLDPLQYIEVNFTKGKGSLGFLNEAIVLDGFSSLRQNLERLELGLDLLRWAFDFSNAGESADLFNLLGNSLKGLQVDGVDLEILRLQFMTKLLWGEGILPSEKPYLLLAQVPIHQGASLHMSTLQKHQLHKDLEYRLREYLDGRSASPEAQI